MLVGIVYTLIPNQLIFYWNVKSQSLQTVLFIQIQLYRFYYLRLRLLIITTYHINQLSKYINQPYFVKHDVSNLFVSELHQLNQPQSQDTQR